MLVIAEILSPPPTVGGADPQTGAWIAFASVLVMLAGTVLSMGRVSFSFAIEGREPRHRVAAVDHRPPTTEAGAPVARDGEETGATEALPEDGAREVGRSADGRHAGAVVRAGAVRVGRRRPAGGLRPLAGADGPPAGPAGAHRRGRRPPAAADGAPGRPAARQGRRGLAGVVRVAARPGRRRVGRAGDRPQHGRRPARAAAAQAPRGRVRQPARDDGLRSELAELRAQIAELRRCPRRVARGRGGRRLRRGPGRARRRPRSPTPERPSGSSTRRPSSSALRAEHDGLREELERADRSAPRCARSSRTCAPSTTRSATSTPR